MKKYFFVIFIFLLSNEKLFASENNFEINLEIGQANSSDNNFSIPNSADNEINLPDGQDLTSYRIKGRVNLKNNQFLYFLYAPFSTDYKFQSDKSFIFDNSNFDNNQNTIVDYKFNSYRIGYFKELKFNYNFKYWIGGILKIRDAKIEVSQNNISKSYDNVGIVPLLGLGFEYFLIDNISIFSHIDSAGFGQGYAYDFNGEFRYHLNNKNALGFGYRVFGGGVDNDEVMNFARFEILYLNYNFKF